MAFQTAIITGAVIFAYAGVYLSDAIVRGIAVQP
jgi:hypothetical protein